MRPNLSMITEGGTVAHFKAAKIGPGQRARLGQRLSPTTSLWDLPPPLGVDQ